MNDKTQEALSAAIARHGLQEHAGLLRSAAAPAIGFQTTPAPDEDIPIGTTKFGGLPDLPADMPWPATHGRPLAFLAQINLADMPAEQIDDWPLPRAGLLSFWFDDAAQPWGYDPKHAGGYQVHLLPTAGAALARRPYPEFTPGDFAETPIGVWEPYPTCTVDAKPIVTIQTSVLDPNAPDDLWDAAIALRTELHGEQGQGAHRLLGAPDVVQNPMEIECQLASNGVYCGGATPDADDARLRELARGVVDWRLLLQLDTDDNPEWMWGDMGCLYFWIRKQDLERQDFSKVWGVLQCG